MLPDSRFCSVSLYDCRLFSTLSFVSFYLLWLRSFFQLFSFLFPFFLLLQHFRSYAHWNFHRNCFSHYNISSLAISAFHFFTAYIFLRSFFKTREMRNISFHISLTIWVTKLFYDSFLPSTYNFSIRLYGFRCKFNIFNYGFASSSQKYFKNAHKLFYYSTLIVCAIDQLKRHEKFVFQATKSRTDIYKCIRKLVEC